MSFMLLLSSSGLAYAQHFCGDFEMMSKITLGKEDLSCGMSMQVPDCDDKEEKSNCCDNEYTSVDTDDTFAKASFSLELDKNFAIAFTSVFILNNTVSISSEADFYRDHSPPPLIKDFQVLYESFLI